MMELIKEKWLKALRSGRYKQGESSLKNKNNHSTEYCCLGVLCNVVNREYGVGKWESSDYCDSFSYNDEKSSALLPDPLRKVLSITTRQQMRLVNLNDTVGKNFKEIADWIERYL